MIIHRKYSQFLLSQQEKRISAVFTVFFLLGFMHLCAMENNGRGTKAIGMANAFVAISDNSWALDYNPAGLAQIDNIQFSAFIVPEQFGLSELRTIAVAGAIPFSIASVGFKVEQFGFELYKETEYGIAGAFNLDQNISIGMTVNLRRLDIDRYGNTQNISVNGGLLARVADNVKVGFNFSNVTGTTVGMQNEKIPQVFTVGASWSPLNNLQLAIEMEKDVRHTMSIKAGVEQIVFSVLAIRAGTANNPGKYSAGIGIRYSLFEFGYAGYSHIDLGWTHQIDLSFKIDG